MAQPHQNNPNNPAGHRPFSFQQPLDTSAAPSRAEREWAGYPEQRFSYVETPIDENTQTFDDERQAELLEEARRRYGEQNPPSQTATPQPQQEAVSQATTPQPHQHAISQAPEPEVYPAPFPPEKSPLERIPSAYQQPPPPLQLHPALAGQTVDQMPTQTPHSPGPLPLKDEQHHSPQRPQRVSLQPDSHPAMFDAPPTSQLSSFSANGPYMQSRIHATAAAPPPSNTFRHSMCACPASDASTCCLGLVCPCLLYSRLTYRMNRRGKRADPTDLLGWHKCDSSCLGFGALCFCGLCGLLAGIVRGRVRRAYDIEGGVAGDCVDGCCCCCCAVIQAEREVRVREEERVKQAGLENNPIMSPYARAAAMSYQPTAS